MRNSQISVLIIEDSRLYRFYLEKVISQDSQLRVEGTAESRADALKLLKTLHPDVITLDLNLPDAQDFEFLRELSVLTDVPVIVVTSSPKKCEEAIGLGARDFISKAEDGRKQTLEQFEMLLRLKIKMQAEHFTPIKKTAPLRVQALKAPKQDVKCIVLGASLGGTETTLRILQQLPPGVPGIVMVQHMPVGFTKAYAMRLDRNCQLDVKEAETGDIVERGKVFVARAGEHLVLTRSSFGLRLRCEKDDKSSAFCPSVNKLFSSAARAAGAGAIGIILTGMGSDGAAGLKEMHEAGAFTIGQDKESCAVFGMPDAAFKAGGVDILLPPDDIAGLLMRKM